MDQRLHMFLLYRTLKLFIHSKKDVMNYQQQEIFGLPYGGLPYHSLSFGMELVLEILGICSGITMLKPKVAKFILMESINITMSILSPDMLIISQTIKSPVFLHHLNLSSSGEFHLKSSLPCSLHHGRTGISSLFSDGCHGYHSRTGSTH